MQVRGRHRLGLGLNRRQGLLDLHSGVGSVDRIWLSELLREAGAPTDLVELCRDANTALLVLREAEKRGIPVGEFVAKAAWKTAVRVLEGSSIALDVAVFDREGKIVGRWG